MNDLQNVGKQMMDIFLEAVTENYRMHPAHISLYTILFYCWKKQQYKNPIDMRRDELMKRSRITGRATYQRCLRELQESGYIKYAPTFNRFANTKITIVTSGNIASC